MSTRINTNVTALQAAANLNTNSNNLAGNIERLSSGLRINSAADDPAGLAISENFKAQISGLTQATSNSNDAINEVKTAEGALSQVQGLLVSMRQLAVAASNLGTNSTVDLQADQTQINSAISSINEIASTTSFGNKKLLDGSATAGSTTTAGTTVATGVTVAAQGLFNAAQAGTYGTVSVTAATAATDSFSITGGTLTSGAATSGTYSGSLIINGTQYNLNTASASNLTQLNASITASGYQASISSNHELTFTSQTTGQLASPAQIDLSGLTTGSGSGVATTSTAIAGTTGAITIGHGTAKLSTTGANDTVATAGNLIFGVNGGPAQTVSLTAGNTLTQVDTALAAVGLTASVDASSNLVVTGTSAGSISITSLGATFASTTLNTLTSSGAAALTQTITPGGLGALDTATADNTVATAGSITITDTTGPATNTVSASVGETLTALFAAIHTADNNVAGSVDASGNLILTGSAGTITAAIAGGLAFGDTGESLGAVGAAAGTAAGLSFAQSGANTLTSAAALFTGILTISGGSNAATLTLGPGTTLAQLNTSLSVAGAAASISNSGALEFYSTTGLAAPTVTAGSTFSAYQAVTASAAGSFNNGANASLTLSNSSNTLTSTSTQAAGNTNYFNFGNGLVVASTVTSGSIVGNVVATSGSTTAGQNLQYQIGADGGETTSLSLGSVAANLLGNGAASYTDSNGTTQTVQTDSIADLNLLTFKGSQDAVAVIDKAINDLSTVQANLGAFQTNVLASNVNTLGTANQNLNASLSTIEDTNLSTEIVDYTKNQILVQAGTSALSQANQAPQAILKLLQ